MFYKFFETTSLSSIFKSHIRKFFRMHWRRRRHDIRRRKLLRIKLRAFDKYNQEMFRQHDIVSINLITQLENCFFLNDINVFKSCVQSQTKALQFIECLISTFLNHVFNFEWKLSSTKWARIDLHLKTFIFHIFYNISSF